MGLEEDLKPTDLPIVFCLFLDFPEDPAKNNTDCSYDPVEICLRCKKPGRFLTGETLEDTLSAGHIICIIIWLMVIIIGTFGTFANILIIKVMKKRNEPRAFDFLLLVLAGCDIVSSVSSILSATAMVVWYQGWDDGPATLFFYYLPYLLCLLGRSGSVYMTVLITVERYVVIKRATNPREWFSTRHTKTIIACLLTLAALVNFPRLSSLVLDKNFEGGEYVPSLRGLKYILRSTFFQHFWYDTMNSIHYQIDIWVPFPLLMIFNVLLFLEIRKFTKRRNELSRKQRRDIRAARMFVPVVIVLFFCNIVPYTSYIVLHFKKIYCRELVIGILLSTATNSAANLPIYYAKGSSLRQEIRAVLPPWLKLYLPDGEGDIVTSGANLDTSVTENRNLEVATKEMVEKL